MTTRSQRKWGAQSAVAPLRRAVVRPPAWSEAQARKEDLGPWGYATPPDLGRAREEHAALAAVLRGAGVEVEENAEANAALYDSVFACDWAFVSDAGAVVLNAGKGVRRPEAGLAERAFREIGVPVHHRMKAPATAEGGDLLWVRPGLLLAGRSYRTNAQGIADLRTVLEPLGVKVVSTPVVHWVGPGSVMHLLSAISLVDHDLAVAYLPLLAVETVELLRDEGIEFIEITREEFDNLGCNILALGPRHCLVVAGNPRIHRELEKKGAEVREFPDQELGLNMGGGPTCLVQAVLRDY